MILKNYSKLLLYISGITDTYVTDMGGTARGWPVNYGTVANTYSSWTTTSSNVGLGIDIGFGSTPVTYDDIKLADSNYQDTTALTFLSGMVVTTGTQKSVTATFTNNGSDPVTVTEVGMYYKHNSGTAGATMRCLIVREVLDTPIVMAPGDTRSFTCNLVYQDPS